jgi:peptide/nickel transport system substrate-binding protein
VNFKEVVRRISLCAVVLGLVVTTQTLTTGKPASAASSGGVLTVGQNISGSVNPVEFDPQQFTNDAGFFPYDWPIYGGLLRETTSGSLVPDLASKVTVPNPSTIDITIRSGVVFSDGSAFTAAAVKAGFEHNLSDPHVGAWESSMYDISSIEVTGTDSLVLNFSQPVASAFYPYLADEESFISSPKTDGAGVADANTTVVGAGPFLLKSYTPDLKIVLVKNPRYWDAKSIRLSGITFVDVSLGPQQIDALESGQVQAEVGLPTTDIPALRANSSLQINSTFADAGYNYAPLCKSSGPLADLQVRQALNYALNRQAINKALLYGQGQPSWSIFPSSSSYYDSRLTNYYAYDPEKAKQLLAKAGYPHGFSTTMMPLPEPAMSQLATVLQNEWKQVGVNVQIVQTSNYVTDLYTNHGAAIGLNPEGEPGLQKVAQYVPGTLGDLCGFSSPTLNGLYSQLQALPPNSSQLTSVWQQVQQFIVGNALSVYINYSPLVTGAAKTVKNLQVIPYIGGTINYWVVSVSG